MYASCNITYQLCSEQLLPDLLRWSNPVSSPLLGHCAESCSLTRTGSILAACSFYLMQIKSRENSHCFLHQANKTTTWCLNEIKLKGKKTVKLVKSKN